MLNTDGIKLSFIIDELAEERGMDRTVLSKIVIEGILAAYQKKYPSCIHVAFSNHKSKKWTLISHVAYRQLLCPYFSRL